MVVSGETGSVEPLRGLDVPPPRVNEVMTREECLSSLRSASVGRLGLSLGALPVILPVGYVVLGEAVLFAVPGSSEVHRACAGRVVAFEADGVDPAGRRWHVLIQGIPLEVERRELAMLGSSLFERGLDAGSDRVLMLLADLVSGAFACG